MVTPARVSDKYLLVGSCKLDGPLFPVSGLAAVGALRGLWLAITALPCKHTAAKVARLAALQFLKRAVPPNPSIEGTSKGYALGRPSCQTLGITERKNRDLPNIRERTSRVVSLARRSCP